MPLQITPSLSRNDPKGEYFRDIILNFLEENNLNPTRVLEWGSAAGDNARIILDRMEHIQLTALEKLPDAGPFLEAIRQQFGDRFSHFIGNSFDALN